MPELVQAIDRFVIGLAPGQAFPTSDVSKLGYAVHAAGVSDRCEFDWQCCFGRCSQGPNVLVREITGAPPPRVGLADLPPRLGGAARQATALYNRVTPAHAAELVAGHVVGGAVVRHLIETVPLRPTEPRPSSPRPDPTVPEVVREEVKVP